MIRSRLFLKRKRINGKIHLPTLLTMNSASNSKETWHLRSWNSWLVLSSLLLDCCSFSSEWPNQIRRKFKTKKRTTRKLTETETLPSSISYLEEWTMITSSSLLKIWDKFKDWTEPMPLKWPRRRIQLAKLNQEQSRRDKLQIIELTLASEVTTLSICRTRSVEDSMTLTLKGRATTSHSWPTSPKIEK